MRWNDLSDEADRWAVKQAAISTEIVDFAVSIV
jgi:hypothetical protein